MSSQASAISSASLEYPALLAVRGLPPTNGVVERVDAGECRLRSVVHFELGTSVGFMFGPEGAELELRGKVVERTRSGPRFTYRIALEPPADGQALGEAIERWRERDVWPALEPQTPKGLVREARRVPTQFPIEYRIEGEDLPVEARASDLSVGGLSLSSKHALIESMLVNLRFALPANGTEIRARARVIWHRVTGPGLFAYGLAFCEMTPETRAGIEEYVAAIRAARHR